MTKAIDSQTQESLDLLRELFPVGSTAHTIQRHVSSSGMSRAISVMHVSKDGEIRDVSWHVARVTGFKLSNKYDGLTVGGAGMDMGFHVVYSLSRALYPEGHKCTGSTGRTAAGNKSSVQRCPSNDHSNDYGMLANKYRDINPEGYADDTEAGRNAYCSARAEWMDSQKLYTKTRTHRDGGYAVSQRWV